MIDAETPAGRNTPERGPFPFTLEYDHAMRSAAFPDRTGPALQGSCIGSPRDILRCLHQAKPALLPGDSLVLFLDRDQHVLTHRRLAANPFCPIGPPIQLVFREAFARRASRLVIVARHPSCRTGPFMPTGDSVQHAAKCSLAGQLLDLRVIDYLVCNETNSQSLLIDYRDELHRYALQYSHQQAHMLPPEICPN